MAYRRLQRPPTPDIGDMDEAAAIESLKRTTEGRNILTATRPELMGEDPNNISLAVLARRIEVSIEEEERRTEIMRRQDLAQMEQKIQREIGNKIKAQLEALTSPDTSEQRVLVDPPTDYGEHPTLGVPARMELRKTLFTCLNAKAKFTGDKGGPAKGELDVVSLLESLARGQAQMGLSESEFLNVFISSCAGTPQSLLVDFIKQVEAELMTIPQIFLRFTDMFFHDLRPDQAFNKLKGLKHRHQFTSLADADNSIRKLARLASLGEKTAERRKLFLQKYYKETLLSIIPDKYISVVQQQIDTKETLSGKELLASDLLGICRAFRVDIDTLFYNKNSGSKSEGQANKASGGRNKTRRQQQQQQNDGQANAVQTRSQSNSSNKDRKNNSQNYSNGQSQRQNNGHNNGNNHNGGQNGNSSRPNGNGNGNGNGSGRNGGNKGRNDKPLNLQECKLCMQTQHQFDQCPLFKPHERTISGTLCSCPMKAYHLQKFCPIRKN